LAGRIGDALHVRPHAGADVQQKEDIHGHVFACEVTNRQHLAVYAEDEIAGVKMCDGAIARIHYLGIDADQRHIAMENQVVVPSEQRSYEGRREQEEISDSEHAGRPVNNYLNDNVPEADGVSHFGDTFAEPPLDLVPWIWMASKSEEDSPPLWLWPNLLSLDAPLVAVLWQDFLAYRFSLPLRPAGRFVLGLTVWAIYLLERLLDAQKPPSPREPARHRFCRRHSKFLMGLLAVVVAADAVIAILWLRPEVLRDGLIPLAGVLIYLLSLHIAGKSFKFPKEIAAASLFTAGTFLTAWAGLRRPGLAWPAMAFFMLCLANIVAIEAWEWRETNSPLHPLTRWLARTYLLWVPAAVIVCALLGRNQWYASIALSAGACAVLFWIGRGLPLEARRALVDGALLSPILFLILR
jgi:hypothetical protein